MIDEGFRWITGQHRCRVSQLTDCGSERSCAAPDVEPVGPARWSQPSDEATCKRPTPTAHVGLISVARFPVVIPSGHPALSYSPPNDAPPMVFPKPRPMQSGNP